MTERLLNGPKFSMFPLVPDFSMFSLVPDESESTSGTGAKFSLAAAFCPSGILVLPNI